MQNTQEDTEWNDVLRRKGVLPPMEKGAEITEEQVQQLVESVVAKHTMSGKAPEEMNVDELDEFEDELDERVFLEYRKKRLGELIAHQNASKFGDVVEITAKDYVAEVNNVGDGIWVVVHLYKQGIPLCSLINQHLNALARKFPTTKFVKSISTLCIANYPDANLPTIFVYINGELKKQLVGPAFFSASISLDEIEWLLSEAGAIKSLLERDPRKRPKDKLFAELGSYSK